MSNLKFNFDVVSSWKQIDSNGNYVLLQESAYYIKGNQAMLIQNNRMVELINDVPDPRPLDDGYSLRNEMNIHKRDGEVFRLLFHNGLDLIVNSWEHLQEVLEVNESDLISDMHQTGRDTEAIDLTNTIGRNVCYHLETGGCVFGKIMRLFFRGSGEPMFVVELSDGTETCVSPQFITYCTPG